MSIDWSDISKLRFRDWDAKIIEVFAPKHERLLKRFYPVKVFVEETDGDVNEYSYTISGAYSLVDGTSRKDIIQIKEEPMSFLEIVELIIKGAKFRDTKVFSKKTILHIDLIDKEFNSLHEDGKRYINTLKYFTENVLYSLDGTNYSKLYKEIK